MEIECFPKEIQLSMESYLSKNELLYFEERWNKFHKTDVYIIAAENGWLDLLEYVFAMKKKI